MAFQNTRSIVQIRNWKRDTSFKNETQIATRRREQVELKNDIALTGKLHSVDQYLNIKREARVSQNKNVFLE